MKGRYKHFKGNEYEVLGIAKHSETREEFVVYKALYGEGQIWTRPRKEFEGTKVIDGKEVKRFQLID